MPKPKPEPGQVWITTRPGRPPVEVVRFNADDDAAGVVVLRTIRRDAIFDPPGTRHLDVEAGGKRQVGLCRKTRLRLFLARYKPALLYVGDGDE